MKYRTHLFAPLLLIVMAVLALVTLLPATGCSSGIDGKSGQNSTRSAVDILSELAALNYNDLNIDLSPVAPEIDETITAIFPGFTITSNLAGIQLLARRDEVREATVEAVVESGNYSITSIQLANDAHEFSIDTPGHYVVVYAFFNNSIRYAGARELTVLPDSGGPPHADCSQEQPNGELVIYVSPIGSGNGQSQSTPMSLQDALLHSASHANEPVFYSLQDGDYGEFIESVNRNAEHKFVAENTLGARFNKVLSDGNGVVFDGLKVHTLSDQLVGVTLFGYDVVFKRGEVKGPGRHLGGDSLFKAGGAAGGYRIECNEIYDGIKPVVLDGSGIDFNYNKVHTTASSPVSCIECSGARFIGNTIFDASPHDVEVTYCDGGPAPSWGLPNDPDHWDDVGCTPEQAIPIINDNYQYDKPHQNLLITRSSEDITIIGNLLYKSDSLGLTLRDGASPSSPIAGSHYYIHHNIVIGSFRAMAGQNLDVRHNIFYSTTLGGSCSNWGNNVTVDFYVGNIVLGNFSGFVSSSCPHLSTVYLGPVDYNVVRNYWAGLGPGDHSINYHSNELPSPLFHLFVDAGVGATLDWDFHLDPNEVFPSNSIPPGGSNSQVDFVPANLALPLDLEGNPFVGDAEAGVFYHQP